MPLSARRRAADPSVPLFRPGENCWGTPVADRMRVLIDAQEYYRTLLASLRQARHSVVVLGWDVDTRLVLTPEAPRPSERVTLERALREALERNPELVIHILCWDFAMIYSLERQLLPTFRRIFNHPRVHFALDGTHPFGASHHQKVVVIDDELAFTGGLDLCVRRWDTRRHRAYDPRRLDSSQKGYHPFHDVQAVLNGEAARWLGRLARERWERATGRPFTVLRTDREDADRRGGPLWPKELPPHFRDVPVALARTQPLQEGNAEIREVERLFVDTIRAARRTVYVEQQYFTSESVARAIAARLRERDCPELLVVVPEVNAGWIEQRSMGVLRDRVAGELLALDRRGRLRMVHPVVEARSARPVPISLHSKLMIVDESVFRLGSANFSNRSMGLDSECDLSVRGEPGSRESAAIAAVRDSLLAEHLGGSEARVSELMRGTGSLFATMDALREGDHALRPFRLSTPAWIDRLTPPAPVMDPSDPVEKDPFFARFLPMERARMLDRAVAAFGLRMLASLAAAMFLARRAPEPARARVAPPGPREPGSALTVPRAAAAVAAGASMHLHPEALIFGACLALGPARGALASSLGLMATLGAGYAAGARRREPPPELGRRPGGFLPSYLVHASMATTVPRAGYHAGKLGSPVAQTFVGAGAGTALRIASLALHAVLFRSFVRRPRPSSLVLLAASAAGRFVGFRWLMRRVYPLHAKRARPT